MNRRLRNLSSREVERVRRQAGFELSYQKGSHRQYIGFIKGQRRKVTVAAPRESYYVRIIASMVRQSGLSEEEWVELLEG